MKKLSKKVERIIHIREARVAVTSADFLQFLSYYLRHKFRLSPADFHRQIIQALQGKDLFIAIMGFRGCAKSTIIEAFAIWLLVTGRSRFLVYLCATGNDAKMALANIRSEIESNDLLKRDYGIDIELKKQVYNEKWSEEQLTIGTSTILARSRAQKVRGLKFNNDRIDTILIDDLEDTEATKTQEKRVATRKWFFTEVMLATKQGVLADDVKIVMIGNLVHADCLLAHLMKNAIVKVFRFPLIDDEGNITWKGLYPDMQAIEKEKEKVMLAGDGMGNVIWAREYLLKIVAEEDQIIASEDIKTYPPQLELDIRMKRTNVIDAGVGGDFAISQKETADCTTFVIGYKLKLKLEGEEVETERIIISSDVFNKRVDFDETIKAGKRIHNFMPFGTKFYLEDVGYQKAALQTFQKAGLSVKAMHPISDKRARLQAVATYVKNGQVLFAETGCEELVNQLVNFGSEKHDDLVDAFSYLIIGLMNKQIARVVERPDRI